MLPSVDRQYATITTATLFVFSEPSWNSTWMGGLNKNQVTEILERTVVNGEEWARIEYGWICLTGYAKVTTVREELKEDNGEKLYATITCTDLTIRPQPNAGTAALGTVRTNARVRIYETITVGNSTWGRTAFGWILLNG